MARKKFLRHKWRTYSKLGKRRRKKQKYRKPRGRDNKMRLKMKGNPKKVFIGYKKQRKKEIAPTIINNLKGLEAMKKGGKIILARIGKKKKIRAVEKARELGLEIINLNAEKYLKNIEREKSKSKKKNAGEKKKAKREKEEKAGGKNDNRAREDKK